MNNRDFSYLSLYAVLFIAMVVSVAMVATGDASCERGYCDDDDDEYVMLYPQERLGPVIPFEGFEGARGPIYDITHARIDVVWYESEKELNAAWLKASPDAEWLVHGFGECSWTPEINRSDCVIHVPLPKSDKDAAMCTLGHEVFHAFKGFYHD